MRALRTHHRFYRTFANMATIASPRINRNLDNRFFAGMALAIAATVLLGFARTYFLAGMFQAKLPSPLVHVHAAVFLSWIIFLAVQIWLVSSGRVGWHRQLGMFGAALALAVVVLGFLTATQSFTRGFSPPGSSIPPATFYAIPVMQVLTFCVLFAAGFMKRMDGAAHKRLMLIATFAILGPAISRWPFPIVHKIPPLISVIIVIFLLFFVVFDLWTRRRIHRATATGGLFLVISQFSMFPIGQTHLWHRFADWILKLWTGAG